MFASMYKSYSTCLQTLFPRSSRPPARTEGVKGQPPELPEIGGVNKDEFQSFLTETSLEGQARAAHASTRARPPVCQHGQGTVDLNKPDSKHFRKLLELLNKLQYTADESHAELCKQGGPDDPAWGCPWSRVRFHVCKHHCSKMFYVCKHHMFVYPEVLLDGCLLRVQHIWRAMFGAVSLAILGKASMNPDNWQGTDACGAWCPSSALTAMLTQLVGEIVFVTKCGTRESVKLIGLDGYARLSSCFVHLSPRTHEKSRDPDTADGSEVFASSLVNALYLRPMEEPTKYFPKINATGCQKIVEANLTYFEGVSTANQRHTVHLYVCKHDDCCSPTWFVRTGLQIMFANMVFMFAHMICLCAGSVSGARSREFRQ